MKNGKFKNLKKKNTSQKLILSAILMVIAFSVVSILGYSFAINTEDDEVLGNKTYQYFETVNSHHLINNKVVEISQVKSTLGNEIDFVYLLTNMDIPKGDKTLSKTTLDTTKYSENDLKKLSALLKISYPYVSLEDMKNNLMNLDIEKFFMSSLDKLDEEEAMSAVQAAIWSFDGNRYTYSNTKENLDNNINENYDKNSKEVEKRINAAIDILLRNEIDTQDITTFEVEKVTKTADTLIITILSINENINVSGINTVFEANGNTVKYTSYSQENNRFIYEFNNVNIDSDEMKISIEASLATGSTYVYKSNNSLEYVGYGSNDGFTQAKANLVANIK